MMFRANWFCQAVKKKKDKQGGTLQVPKFNIIVTMIHDDWESSAKHIVMFFIL